jgi:hypothetical protein
MKRYHLIKHHAVKTHWGVEIQLHPFLTLVLDGREWSALRPAESALGTHWIGVSLGPRASLDVVVKKPLIAPARN